MTLSLDRRKDVGPSKEKEKNKKKVNHSLRTHGLVKERERERKRNMMELASLSNFFVCKIFAPSFAIREFTFDPLQMPSSPPLL